MRAFYRHNDGKEAILLPSTIQRASLMFIRYLSHDLKVIEVSKEQLNSILNQHFKRIFENRADEAITKTIADDSLDKIEKRRQLENIYQLRLVLYSGEIPIGWHFGQSTDPETYYMQNSAIIEEFRNKGLYSKFLNIIMEKIREDGFQVITSSHHPNNAAVLIPKLKRGFVIGKLHETGATQLQKWDPPVFMIGIHLVANLGAT